MEIRKAVPADLPRLLEIYAAGRRFMAEHGNPTQWPAHYPPAGLLEEDIAAGQQYVCTEEGRVFAAFALIPGEDPTYVRIEAGAWPDDAPYATIHRLAADGTGRGVTGAVIAWCAAQSPVLRADTHADNAPMQHLLEKHGFVRCGIIYTDDGTPRLAYQRG